MPALAVLVVALLSLGAFAGDVRMHRDHRRAAYAADAVALAAARPGWSHALQSSLERSWSVSVVGVRRVTTPDGIDVVDVSVRGSAGMGSAVAVARTLEDTRNEPVTAP